MILPLPALVSVPTLCRQLFAKRIRTNTSINNLFPHHGPGTSRTPYEDWYAVSLCEGRRVTLILEGAPDFARIYLRDADGEIVQYGHAKTRGDTLELTVLKHIYGGTHYVVVQTDEVYTETEVTRANRYTLTVVQ